MERVYFYCEANATVYSETEMSRSVYPVGRFLLLGSFKCREEAEIEAESKGYVVSTISKRI